MAYFPIANWRAKHIDKEIFFSLNRSWVVNRRGGPANIGEKLKKIGISRGEKQYSNWIAVRLLIFCSLMQTLIFIKHITKIITIRDILSQTAWCMRIPAATETLKESTIPVIGILQCKSDNSKASSLIPLQQEHSHC
ncbi:hypothetical protein CR513_59941, partial [Mucuna pruriens]